MTTFLHVMGAAAAPVVRNVDSGEEKGSAKEWMEDVMG